MRLLFLDKLVPIPSTFSQITYNLALDRVKVRTISDRHEGTLSGLSGTSSGNDRKPIPRLHPQHRFRFWYDTNICLAQRCQVRRLYHLFGYDPR
jgi:hypothetical protein